MAGYIDPTQQGINSQPLPETNSQTPGDLQNQFSKHLASFSNALKDVLKQSKPNFSADFLGGMQTSIFKLFESAQKLKSHSDEMLTENASILRHIMTQPVKVEGFGKISLMHAAEKFDPAHPDDSQLQALMESYHNHPKATERLTTELDLIQNEVNT